MKTSQLYATVAGTLYNACERELPWQRMGLSYTASGYGKRIPTRFMVRYAGKWRRIYACQYSNAGTLFIGKSIASGLIVTYIGTEAP